MDEQEPTCGHGMAAQAPFPEALGEVAAALSGVLTQHTAALPAGDPAADAERTAWQGVAEQLSAAAARLNDTAVRMRASHDVPTAPHDMTALVSGRNVEVFDTFVAAQQKLRSVLDEMLPGNEEMQRMMREASE